MFITAPTATLALDSIFRLLIPAVIPTGTTGVRLDSGHTGDTVIILIPGGHLMCLVSVLLTITTTCGGTTIGDTATTITTGLHEMVTIQPAMKSGA